MLTVVVVGPGYTYLVPLAPRAVTVVPSDPRGAHLDVAEVLKGLFEPGERRSVDAEFVEAWVPTGGFLRWLSGRVSWRLGEPRRVSFEAGGVVYEAGSPVRARLAVEGHLVCTEARGVYCVQAGGPREALDAAGFLAYSAAARLALGAAWRPGREHEELLDELAALGYVDVDDLVLGPVLGGSDVLVAEVNPHPEALPYVAAALYTIASAGAAVTAFTNEPRRLASALASLPAGLEKRLARMLGRIPPAATLTGSTLAEPQRSTEQPEPMEE